MCRFKIISSHVQDKQTKTKMKGRQTAIQKFDRITSCNRTKAKYDHIKHQSSSSQQPKHSPFILHSCKITTPSFIKSDRKNVSHYIVQATKLEINLSKHALAKMQCYNSPILTSSTSSSQVSPVCWTSCLEVSILL